MFKKLINFLFHRHCKECDRLQAEVITLRLVASDQEGRYNEIEESLEHVDRLHIEADDKLNILLNKIRQLRQQLEESKKDNKRLKRLLIKLAGFFYRFTANAEQYAEEINKEVEKDYKLIDATHFMNNLSNKKGVKEEFNRRGYQEQLEAMGELVRLNEQMGLYNDED